MQSTFLEKAIKRLKYGPNPDQDESGLHPDRTVIPASTTPDPVEAVNAFRESLANEEEIDVGDWKRDVNAALIQLKENLIGQDYWVIRTVEHMQSLLNWSWREDVENLKFELNKRADGILKGLRKQAFRERLGQKIA